MPNITTNTFDIDDAGLEAVLLPRDDLLLEEPDGTGGFSCAEGPFDHYLRTITVEELAGGQHRVTERTEWWLAIPLWRHLFNPLVRRYVIRRDPPTATRGPNAGRTQAPWWSPPSRLDAQASRVLSLLCGLSMLAGYLGTIITQTITFAADQFGANKSSQGATLAGIRVGVLLSLVILAVADRRGRQRLLVLSAVGGTLAAAAGALAPNLFALGATQTVSRAFSTAMVLLIAITAAEEMPAGGRAYAASVLAMTAALGAGGAVMLLPLADLGPGTWRIIYAAPMLALPFFWTLARRIPESRRFVRAHAKVTMAGHRGRLALLASASFFGLLFLAPVTQFQNDFLRDEHGFSALKITIYTICTSTPGGIGIVVGGRLADVRGRRVVGAVGTVGGALLLIITYQVSGPLLWVTALTGVTVAAVTVPALGVYGPELFPTSIRGRANGLITLASVAGSSVGLFAAGRLADHFGRLGIGIALLGIGPMIVAALVLGLYPETAHTELEDLNPEDAVTSFIPPVL